MRAARFVWTLPTNLFGHLAGAVVSGTLPWHARRVGGPAAHATLYRIRDGIGLDWVGAVTLGHAVLHRRDIFDGPVGRLVLAHELAHTRQHDLLGPLYLPLHVLAQSTSALLSLFTKGPVHSRVHDHNPLEQTLIVIAAHATREWPRGEIDPGFAREAFLREFGV